MLHVHVLFLQANSYLGSSMIDNRQLDAWFGTEDPGSHSSFHRQVTREVNGSTAMETASGMPNRPANEAELLHANAKVTSLHRTSAPVICFDVSWGKRAFPQTHGSGDDCFFWQEANMAKGSC